MSAGEVAVWLAVQALAVEWRGGEDVGHPYTDASPRAIFWARRPVTKPVEGMAGKGRSEA